MSALEEPFRPLLAVGAELLESPVWDAAHGRLLVADVRGGRILAVSLEGALLDEWRLEPPIGSFGLADDGRFVVALRDAVILFDPATGARQALTSIEAESPCTRLNDGKVGPDGAFWVGTMDEGPARQRIGALYRVTCEGAERRVEGVAVSNGLAWSVDGRTMFHSDGRGPWIDAWDFDPLSGDMMNRRRIAAPDDAAGRPDGGATDARGRYWSAGVSAGVVNLWSAEGRLIERFDAGVRAPTMPAFGGADMRTLFLTSLRRPDDPDPNAGGLLAGRAAEPGVAVDRFRTCR